MPRQRRSVLAPTTQESSHMNGVGDTLPIGLKDVSTYPVLIQGFLDRGYSEDEIKKILGENLLRVWGEVERVASES